MEDHIFTKKEKKQLWKCLSDEELYAAEEAIDQFGENFDAINKYLNKLYIQASLSIPRDMDIVMYKKEKIRKLAYRLDKIHSLTTVGIRDGNINDCEAEFLFDRISDYNAQIVEFEESLVEEIVKIQKRERHLEKLSGMIEGESDDFGPRL